MRRRRRGAPCLAPRLPRATTSRPARSAPLGRVEAPDVVGRGEFAHQDDVVAGLGTLFGFLGREHDRALRSAGRGGDGPRQLGVGLLRVECRVEECVQRARVDRREGLLPAEQALADRVEAKRTAACAGRLALRV